MNIKSKISVRDAMTSKVITIQPSGSLTEVANLMLKHDIGGVVVTQNGKPIGIITEKDFTIHLARGKDLQKIKAKDAMSSRLITVNPGQSLMDAARVMTKNKVRKLPVKSKDKLIGILTAEDIVRIAPREIELLLELAALKSEEARSGTQGFSESGTEGECEICGNYSDYLSPMEGGTYVCGDCKEAEEGGEE